MTIVLCVPGHNIHHRTVSCMINLWKWLLHGGWTVHFAFGYAPDLFHVRNSLLGMPKSIDEPRPFRDRPYDYMLWIDSDMTFTPEDFHVLHDRDMDIVSGAYPMKGGEVCAATDFSYTNGTHRFLKANELDREDPFEVSWAGFGFMLIKEGIFEKTGYPWFKPYLIPQCGLSLYSAEDAGFCLDAKDKGFITYLDPTVRLGHLKEQELRFGKNPDAEKL